MNGFILLLPALTFGQVDAGWATQDNLDREWVITVVPGVLNDLQSGKYQEVASNISEQEPAARRLRIRFLQPGATPAASPDVLNAQNTVGINADWQRTVNKETNQEVSEFVVQVTPDLIATLQTGRYEIVEVIPAPAGSVRQFRFRVGTGQVAQNRQPAPLPQQPVSQANGGQNQSGNSSTPTFTPRTTSPVAFNGNLNPNGSQPTNNYQVPNTNTPYQPNNNSQGNPNNFTPNPQGQFNTNTTTYQPNANYQSGQNNFTNGPPTYANGQPNYTTSAQNPNYSNPQTQYQYPPPAYNNAQQNWGNSNAPNGQGYNGNNFNTQYGPNQQNTFRPNNQVAQNSGATGNYQGQRSDNSRNLDRPNDYVEREDRSRDVDRRSDDFANRRDDPERDPVTRVNRESTAPETQKSSKATTDFFWLMIFLFLSIGFNIYLVWVAWQTYWKYRDLVSDTRTPRTAGAESY